MGADVTGARATDGTVRRFHLAACALATIALAISASACGGDGENETRAETQAETQAAEAPEALDPADFTARVDHPLVAFSLVRLKVFEGSERDPDTGETIETRAESRTLARTDRVAGVPVAVIDVKEYEDGELVEHTLDYHAQHRDGSVWYLGERVDDYEDGKLVGHEGQWYAGKDGANAGLFMPARPKVGDVFEQERAPGVAEDRSTVVELGVAVATPAGKFSDCIRTEDFAPLDNLTEFKYYCPGVGLVREDLQAGRVVLVRYR